MQIEHMAMYVQDLEAARDFLVKYLGGVSNEGYHNKSTGFDHTFYPLTAEQGWRS